MLGVFDSELSKIGLNVNADKCNLQCSNWPADRSGVLEVDGIAYPVVQRNGRFGLRGTVFTLDGSSEVEFDHGIKAAWSKFWSLRRLLGKRDGSLTQRLRLLESSVAKTRLWCTRTWTPCSRSGG